MNKSTLDTQFQVLRPDFPYSSYTSAVLEWYNLAQRAIADKCVVADRQKATTTANMKTIDLPDTCIEVKRDGVYVNKTLVEVVGLTKIIDEYGTNWKDTDYGTPKYCIQEGEQLIFVPPILTADLEVEIHFWGYPNDLSSDSDIPFTTGDTDNGYDYHNHLRGFDELVLDYALRMADYSLGIYSTKDSALASWYARLEGKVNEKKPTPNRPQQFGIDGYRAGRIKERRGIS